MREREREIERERERDREKQRAQGGRQIDCHRQPGRASRQSMDVDESNTVSFQEMCQHMKKMVCCLKLLLASCFPFCFVTFHCESNKQHQYQDNVTAFSSAPAYHFLISKNHHIMIIINEFRLKG
jgi:hypothetical protein